MTSLQIYADATALIGLSRIDRLDLLRLVPTPVGVTTRVWSEVTADPAKPGVPELVRARGEGLLVVVEEGDAEAFPQLDAGESTVLTAAAAARAAVLVDERKARALIERNAGLRQAITRAGGIVGLILLAKRTGVIPAVRPLLDDLIRQGFRISPALYAQALRAADEST
jgi:predicted nucleic acid-binding protein